MRGCSVRQGEFLKFSLKQVYFPLFDNLARSLLLKDFGQLAIFKSLLSFKLIQFLK